MIPQPRRRWALFPRSIISDYDNPSAYLYREMARQIARLDDEARFYEERANIWLRDKLRQDGSRALLDFQDQHPYVHYVTYDPRSGQQLADWISLILATVDIAVVDCAAPTQIVRWTGEMTRPHLHTFLLDPHGELAEASEIHDRVGLYSGVCLGATVEGAPAINSHQYLIRYGPADPGPGHNGNAAQHIERTAAELVREMVQAVDESLLRQQRRHPDDQQ